MQSIVTNANSSFASAFSGFPNQRPPEPHHLPECDARPASRPGQQLHLQQRPIGKFYPLPSKLEEREEEKNESESTM